MQEPFSYFGLSSCEYRCIENITLLSVGGALIEDALQYGHGGSEMNQYVTGTVIKELREKNNITQLQLAEKLGVSDKTISKWETGKGYPDITLLEPIADVFSVSVAELISGNTVCNSNVSANMLRSRFYVCPVCGNVIHCMGEAVVQCHGVLLQPEEDEETDEDHKIFVERVEDEYFV